MIKASAAIITIAIIWQALAGQFNALVLLLIVVVLAINIVRILI